MVSEIQRQKDLQTYFNIDQVPTEQQVYEFMARFSTSQLNKITYNILRPYYSKKIRAVTTYIVDATPVEVDINTIKKYIKPEDLKGFKANMGILQDKRKLYWI